MPHMLDPTVVLHNDKIDVDAFKSMVDDLFFMNMIQLCAQHLGSSIMRV